MAKPQASPETEGEECSFTPEREEVGWPVINKKSIGVSWGFKVQWFSLAELQQSLTGWVLPREEENLSSSLWGGKVAAQVEPLCKVRLSPLGLQLASSGRA